MLLFVKRKGTKCRVETAKTLADNRNLCLCHAKRDIMFLRGESGKGDLNNILNDKVFVSREIGHCFRRDKC